jgi:hypothetical protein
MRPPLVLFALAWLALLTILVVWPVFASPPWERKQEAGSLLCEDALVRRRESDLTLARLGRDRQQTIVDAKRLSEIMDEAKSDIQRYC